MADRTTELIAAYQRGDITGEQFDAAIVAPPGDPALGANAAAGGAPVARPMRPEVKPLKQPDPDAALMELVDAEAKRLQAADLTLSPAQARERAVQSTMGMARPDVDRENITLRQAANKAFARREGIDATDAVQTTFAEQAPVALREALWAATGPIGLARKAKQVYDAGSLRPVFATAEHKAKAGEKPLESNLGRFIRVGTTLLDAPVREALTEGIVDPAFGITPKERGLTNGTDVGVLEDPVESGRNFLLRVLQRIERGQGSWDDLYAAGGKAGLTGTSRSALGLVGLGLDVVVPTEAMLVGPVLKLGRAAKVAKMMGKVAPEVRALDRFMAALMKAPTDIGKVTERGLAKAMQDGTFKLDDVPDELLRRMDAIAGGDVTKPIGAGLDGTGEDKAFERATDELVKAFGMEGRPDNLLEDFFARINFGQEAGDVAGLTPVQRGFVKLAGEAVRQTAREALGDFRLVNIADGVLVTPAEARRITGEADKLRKPLEGLQWTRAEEGGVTLAGPLNGSQEAALRELNVFGREVPEAITPEFMRQVIGDWKRVQAGLSADFTHVLQGTRQFHATVLNQARQALVRGQDVPGLQNVSKVVEDVLTKFVNYDDLNLPRATKIVMDQATADLANITSTALRDVKNALAEGLSYEDAMARIAGSEYAVVPEGDLEVIKKVMGVRKGEAAKIDAAASDILKTPADLGDETRALLSSTKPADRLAGVKQWREVQLAKVRRTVDDMLAVVFEDPIRQTRERGAIKTGAGLRQDALYLRHEVTDIEDAIANAPLKLKLAAYQEVLETGKFGGSAMTALKQKVAPKFVVGLSDDVVSFGWLLRTRARKAEGEVVKKLITHGLMLPEKHPVAQAAAHILTGKGQVRSRAVWEQAKRLIYRSGLSDVFDRSVTFIKRRNGDRSMVISPTLESELVRARNLGLLGGVDLGALGAGRVPSKATKTWRALLNLQKGLVTLTAPAFYVTNFLSVPFMIHTTQGGKALRGTLGQLFRRPDLVGQMVKRLTKFEQRGGEALGLTVRPYEVLPPARRSGLVLDTPQGPVHLDELVEEARTFGIERTYSNVETAANLEREIAAMQPGLVPKLKRSVQGWVGLLRELSSATELVWRSSVYLDKVAEGAPLDEAARFARESAFDYSKLTEFEQRYMRDVVLFYTFQRKNLDAFLKAAFTHPDRVLAQMRFFRDQANWWSLSEEQQAEMGPRRLGRLVLGADRDTQYNPDGSLSRTQGLRLSATAPMPMPEAIFLMYNLTNTATLGMAGGGDLGESVSELGGQLAGPLDLGLQALTGRTGSGYAATSRYSRRVPQWMMETPGFSDVMHYMGAEAVPVRDERDIRYATKGTPTPVVWMLPHPNRGPEAKRNIAIWRTMNTYMGRLIRVLQQVDDRMNHYEYDTNTPRRRQEGILRAVAPETTPLFGVNTYGVRTDAEIDRRRRAREEKQLRANTRALRDAL